MGARPAAAGLLAAATLLAALLPGALAAPGSPPAVERIPERLPERTETLRAALANVSEAEDLAAARRAHEDVQARAPELVPHARDLMPEDAELLGTYLAELNRSLAEGNLSDARSLAQAAANLVHDELRPRVEAWTVNRTALTAGPLRWASDGVIVVPLLLVNPPPAGVGAFDASLHVPPDRARPVAASIATGQGETSVDRANGTARIAAFDAQQLAHLGTGTQVVVLGEARFSAEELTARDTLPVEVRVHGLATPDGQPTPALGLAHAASVPADEHGLVSALGQRWVALGLVAGMAAVSAIVTKRWLEV